MATHITPNFTLEELTSTCTGIPNTPPVRSVVMSKIKAMARLLQSVRDILAKPIIVNSCYRCKEVNDRVGGSPRSYHLFGSAVDISVYKYTDLDKVTLENALRVYKPVEFIKYDTFWHVAFNISKLGNFGPVTTYEQEYPDFYGVDDQVEDL